MSGDIVIGMLVAGIVSCVVALVIVRSLTLLFPRGRSTPVPLAQPRLAQVAVQMQRLSQAASSASGSFRIRIRTATRS